MAGNSTASVVTGITANGLVTVAKFIGFGFTGSSALLSEAIHSLADTSNQALLLLGLSRSERPADEKHPFGYGRDRFFWGLVSALGIFFIGAGVTLMHGIEGLIDPHPVHHTWVTWVVLAIAFVLESLALVVAIRGMAKDAAAAGVSFKRYVTEGKDPTALAVLLEDSAAVFGVVVVTICILLTELTGEVIWDALASIFVGLLLGFVAVFLVAKNRDFLITKSIDKEVADTVRGIIIGHDTVDEISAFKGTVLALGKYRIHADVDFDGGALGREMLADQDLAALRASFTSDEAFVTWAAGFSERLVDQLGDEIDEIEAKIRAAVPEAEHVDLEQD